MTNDVATAASLKKDNRIAAIGGAAVSILEYETARAVVYPWLCDSMGHFATQHYMKVFDDATYHLLARLGYVLRDSVRTGAGWADVSHSIEYRHEVVAGDLLLVYSSVQRVGNKSLTYRSRMVRLNPEPQECAVLTGVMVHFDLQQRRALELPAAIRQAAVASSAADDGRTSV